MTSRFFRMILYYIRVNERLLILKERARPGGLLTRMYSAGMLKFSQQTVCRGLAIGMFWGFVPMPFQMAPAALFCWLARANLPVAIVCVWISNPLTYVPILFMEYTIGAWLFGTTSNVDIQYFTQLFTAGFSNVPLEIFHKIFIPMLQGSIIVSIVSAVVGYVFGIAMFRYIHVKQEAARLRRRCQKHKHHASHPH